MDRRTSAATLAATATLLLGGSFYALAQVGAAEAGLSIPYQGRLELGGNAVTGTADAVFRVFDGPDQGATQIGGDIDRTLELKQGAFSTLIGPLDAAAFMRATLWMEVEVDGTVLAGRQLISSARASRGLDGALPDGSYLRWRESGAELQLCSSSTVTGGDCAAPAGRRALVHDTGDALTINAAGDYPGGTRVDSDLEVTGAVRGDLACVAGFTAVAGGRLCISELSDFSDNMYDGTGAAGGAVADCRSRSVPSRVCSYSEIQQACGAGIDVMRRNDASFTPSPDALWYDDLLEDDLFMYASVFECGSPNETVSGAPNAISGSAHYRCCY